MTAITAWRDVAAQISVQMNTAQLARLFERLTYNEDWSFSVVAHAGWQRALQIRVNVRDSNCPRGAGMVTQLLVDHQFQVPYWTMSYAETERWLFDCILLVDRHEACENFRLDGIAPFYPEHGEGSDPYRVRRVDEAVG